MKYLIATFSAFIFLSYATLQNDIHAKRISQNLQIISVSEHAFIHVSYSDSQFGRIASNGLVLIQNRKAVLFDTPMDEPTTIELFKFIHDSLNATVTTFIPNHWHADCIGGLEYLHRMGIESYANKMTAELAFKNGYSVPKHVFTDSLQLQFGEQQIFCFYPGAAHSMDNIVVWIPDEKILFGGCMVKALMSDSMGNYADGDLKDWPGTIKKVMEKFPSASIIIPGHGQAGDFSLLTHTFKLASIHAK